MGTSLICRRKKMWVCREVCLNRALWLVNVRNTRKSFLMGCICCVIQLISLIRTYHRHISTIVSASFVCLQESADKGSFSPICYVIQDQLATPGLITNYIFFDVVVVINLSRWTKCYIIWSWTIIVIILIIYDVITWINQAHSISNSISHFIQITNRSSSIRSFSLKRFSTDAPWVTCSTNVPNYSDT